MKTLHEEPGYMSADPLLHRDNLDQRPPEHRESGALGLHQPKMLEIRLDPGEASIYVSVRPQMFRRRRQSPMKRSTISISGEAMIAITSANVAMENTTPMIVAR